VLIPFGLFAFKYTFDNWFASSLAVKNSILKRIFVYYNNTISKESFGCMPGCTFAFLVILIFSFFYRHTILKKYSRSG
jgi:hypothetical protein